MFRKTLLLGVPTLLQSVTAEEQLQKLQERLIFLINNVINVENNQPTPLKSFDSVIYAKNFLQVKISLRFSVSD